MIGLKSHSIKLYRELAADPEYPVGYHYGDGGIRLANRPEQMDGYRHFAALAKGMGVEFEVIDAAACAQRHPLLATDDLIGGLWDPHDGDIDPAQLCQALARRARLAGAEIHRNTPVTGLRQLQDETWVVDTPKGEVHCDIVVNAGGYRVNEIGAMMGVHHPVMSMEHQYFLTEDIPDIVASDQRMPLIRCPISDFYCRQEKNGLLVGFYEQGCKTWGMDGIDPDFVNALCPDDLDRVMDVLAGAFARLPALQETGIRAVVNGPITYTIDGAPLVGPIPGKRNAFCIIGLRAGLGEGGGHGWLLAQQIVHGEACYDTWCLDPRRFGPHSNTELCARMAVQDYQNEFRFHYPNEHRPAARMARCTALTPILERAGAHFAPINGWERAEFYAPDLALGHSFRFDEAFEVVRTEVSAVQNAVGLCEVNGFTRIEITGADRHKFMDRLICGQVPRRDGRVGLTYLLTTQGMVKAEATLANLPASDRGPARIWYGAAAAAERHDMDWLSQNLRDSEDVHLRPLVPDFVTLVLAGPKARDVLTEVARGDWSQTAFPWLSVREATIGFAPAIVMAVSFSGEWAYELHIPQESLYAAYLALKEAGDPLGLRLFGMRAVESMRIEKGFLHWKADLLTEFDPFETGLDRFVRMEKPDFIGKTALKSRQDAGAAWRMVSLRLACSDRAALPGAPILMQDKVVGSVTSGAFGYRTGLNLAMGFVRPELAATGQTLHLDLLGDQIAAEVIPPCPYDPGHLLLREPG